MKKFYCSTKVISIGLLLFFTLLNGCKIDLTPEPTESKSSGTMNALTASDFNHPGLINNHKGLDFIRLRWAAGGPRRTMFDNSVGKYLLNLKYNKPSANVTKVGGSYPTATFKVTLYGSAVKGEEEGMKNDALLAYAHALAWVAKKDQASAQKAIDILNGYGNGRFAGYDQGAGADGNTGGLESAWMAPTFVEAAEILRHYKGPDGTWSSGWTAADIAKFTPFLIKLQGYIQDFAIGNDDITTDLNTTTTQDASDIARWDGLRRNNSNQGVACAWANMAVGVFLSADTDPTIAAKGAKFYNDGVNFITGILTNINYNEVGDPKEPTYMTVIKGKSPSTGQYVYVEGYQRLINTYRTLYLNTTTKAVKGFVYDNGTNDCFHFQYVLNGLTYIAEIARNQGDEYFYTFAEGVLLDGYNYQYSRHEKVLGDGVRDFYDKRSCNDDKDYKPGIPISEQKPVRDTTFIYPGVEVAYRYYLKKKTYNITSIKALRDIENRGDTDPNTIARDYLFLGFTTFTHYEVPFNWETDLP